MFKNKNTITYATIVNMLSFTQTTVYTHNSFNNNTVLFKNNHLKTYVVVLNTEIGKSMLVDITATYINNVPRTFSLFYNHIWDQYIVHINSLKRQISNKIVFYNSNWIEREVYEMTNIQYSNNTDNRHLLLNYNDNVNHLKKNQNVQPTYEIKTNWHKRKINKINNKNIEL